jgi:hypothetical protein
VLAPPPDRGKDVGWRRELRTGKGFVLRDDLHVVAERGARLRWKPVEARGVDRDDRRAPRPTEGGADPR